MQDTQTLSQLNAINCRPVSAISSALVSQSLARASDPKRVWGIAPWGITKLDDVTGGIQEHTLTVLGARPQVGKSAISGQISVKVAEHFVHTGSPLRVRLILFEMSGEVFFRRVACARTGVQYMSIMRGECSDAELDKYNDELCYLGTLPIDIADRRGSFQDVKQFLDQPQVPTGFWLLDHIALFQDVVSNTSNQTGAIVSAANFCQQMCYRVAPGLIIAHMNRDSMKTTDKRPTLESYAGSDQIGRNADVGLALHRPWLYADIPEDQKAEPQPAELIILKNREGPGGIVPLIYTPRLTRFDEVDMTLPAPAPEAPDATI